MKKEEPVSANEGVEEKPPIMGSWKNLYLLLIGALLFQIILYYLITISFS